MAMHYLKISLTIKAVSITINTLVTNGLRGPMQNQKFNLQVKTLSGQRFTLVVAARDLNYIYYQIRVLMTQFPDSLHAQIEKGRFDVIELENVDPPDPPVDRKLVSESTI